MLVVAGFWANMQCDLYHVWLLIIVWFGFVFWSVLCFGYGLQRLWPCKWCAGASEITQLTCAFHPRIQSFSPSPPRNSGVLTKQTVFLHWIYPRPELLPDTSAKWLPHGFANEEKNQNGASFLSLNIFSRVWKANSTYLTLDVEKKKVFPLLRLIVSCCASWAQSKAGSEWGCGQRRHSRESNECAQRWRTTGTVWQIDLLHAWAPHRKIWCVVVNKEDKALISDLCAPSSIIFIQYNSTLIISKTKICVAEQILHIKETPPSPLFTCSGQNCILA